MASSTHGCSQTPVGISTLRPDDPNVGVLTSQFDALAALTEETLRLASQSEVIGFLAQIDASGPTLAVVFDQAPAPGRPSELLCWHARSLEDETCTGRISHLRGTRCASDWLSGKFPFRNGPISTLFRQRLQDLCWLPIGLTCGFHQWEFCSGEPAIGLCDVELMPESWSLSRNLKRFRGHAIKGPLDGGPAWLVTDFHTLTPDFRAENSNVLWECSPLIDHRQSCLNGSASSNRH
jgi:hypothetical protein